MRAAEALKGYSTHRACGAVGKQQGGGPPYYKNSRHVDYEEYKMAHQRRSE